MASYVEQDLGFADRAPVVAEASATVDAGAEEVWAVLADHRTWPRWFSSVRSCEPTSQPEHGVGSTRRVGLGGGIRVDERFIAWDEPSVWAFTGVAGPPLLRSLVERVTLADAGDGRTQVTYRMALEPRTLAAPLVKAARSGIERNLAKALVALGAEAVSRRER